ncbi:MAG TPA: hypothetical protein VGG45_01370 [Terracidiphilus sp.]
MILQEMENILKSLPFRTSSRSKQFLSYVILKSLDGHTEELKERTIGAEVFKRDPNYSTGDDPVVRVQAGEVRRRLEQYYHSALGDLPVHIEIPVGSYVPEFRWGVTEVAVEIPAALPAATIIPEEPADMKPVPVNEAPGKFRLRFWIIAICCICLLAAGVSIPFALRSHNQPQSTIDKFWAPISNSSQPVLICLAKPVAYRPTPELFNKYSQTHPGTFQTEVERENDVLPLDANEKISWKDIEILPGYGVASGDVDLAVRISTLLTRMGKPSQVRIGNTYSFEDLRNSPTVVGGAFNNRWTMQMTSNLHFVPIYTVGIQEQVPSGRLWNAEIGPKGYITDYAIVTRLIDSKTGQFFVALAGLGTAGTQTAGEFVSTPKYLDEGLRSAPPDWYKKNMQIVVQTTVTDSIPGPPHVVATYFW